MAAQRSQDAAALESAQRSRSEAQAELLAVKQEMARQASEVAAKSAEAEKRARAADQMILDARRHNDQAALEEAKKARQAAEEEKMTMAKELQELKTAAAKQPVSVAPPIVEPPPAPAPSPVVEPTPKTPQNVLDGILGARTNAAQIQPVEEEDYELEEEEEEVLQPPPPSEAVQPPSLPPQVVEAPALPPAVQPPSLPPPVVEPQPTPPPAVQPPTQPTPDELRQQLFANAIANPELRARYEPEGPSQLSDSQALFANATPNPELQDKYRRDNEVDVRQQAEAEAGIPEQNPFEAEPEPAESPPPPADQPQSDGWTPLDINNMNTGVYIMPGLFGAAGATYIPTIYKFFNQPKMKDNINVSDEDKFAKIAEAQTSMRTYLESLKAKMAVSTGKSKDDIVSLGKEAVNTFKILLDNFKSQEQTTKRRTELETRQGKIKAASDKEAAKIKAAEEATAKRTRELDEMIGQFPDSYQQLASELDSTTSLGGTRRTKRNIRNRSTRRR